MSSMVVPLAFDANGKVIENDAARPAKSINTYSEAHPLVSQALGCHPDQVEEYREAARRQGLTGVRYRDDGTCELTSRGRHGRAGLLRASGLHDNDGGYSD